MRSGNPEFQLTDMDASEKIEKERGREFALTVTELNAEGGTLALAGKLVERADGTWIVPDAYIDQTDTGALSSLGMGAYRVLPMVEVIVARAMGLKVIDPREELAQLQKENGRLRQQLWLAEGEIKDLKGELA
jgi:hypothetical protein